MIDVTMPNLKELRRHNATGRLQAGADQGGVARRTRVSDSACVTTQELLVTDQRQPDRERPPQPQIDTSG